MPDGLRVLIADDHPPTLAGVCDALQGDGWSVCAQVADGEQAISAAIETRPDVALLDIHMPAGGIHAADQICRHLPETAVVMLTASRDDDDLFDALRAGAVGYLLKDIDPARLGPALRAVLEGEAALPRRLMARVLEEFAGRDRRRVLARGKRGEPLTGREFEVLDLLRSGLTTEQVAQRLFISAVTVRGHVSLALKKLRATDRREAFRLLDEDDR